MTQLADFAALFASARVVDLSPLIENGMPRWPTHPPLVINPTVTHEHDGYYCQTLFAAEHTGAHVDAPAHIHPDMMEHTIDTLAPDALIGKASVFDLSNLNLEAGDLVDVGDLALLEKGHPEPLGAGDVALLNYGWLHRFWRSDRRWRKYAENAPGLTQDAALWLAERNVRAVGADTIACDQPLREGVELQKSYGHEDYFLPRHIYILEALSNLHLLPPRCFFVGIPLKISGGSGSPLRPLALIFDEG